MKSKTLYLIVRHIIKARKGDNNHVTENVVVAERLKMRDEREATVIIDLFNGKVVKDRQARDSVEVFTYYVDRYQSLITKTTREWINQSESNLDTIKRVVDGVSNG